MLQVAVLIALSAVAEERAVAPLFPEARVGVTESGMTVVFAPQTHVLVARIEDGGKVSTSCAATEEAVQALLVAPKTEARRE